MFFFFRIWSRRQRARADYRYRPEIENLETRSLLSSCFLPALGGAAADQKVVDGTPAPGESIYGPGFASGLELARTKSASSGGGDVRPIVTASPITILPPIPLHGAVQEQGPGLEPVNPVRAADEAIQRLMLGIDEAIARVGVPNEPKGALPGDANQALAGPVAHAAPLLSAPGDGYQAITDEVDPAGRGNLPGATLDAVFSSLGSNDSSPSNAHSAMNQRAEEPARLAVGSELGAGGLQRTIEEPWVAAFLMALLLESREPQTRGRFEDRADSLPEKLPAIGSC